MWSHRLTLHCRRPVCKRKEGRSWREARVTAGERELTKPFQKVAQLTLRRPLRPAGRCKQGPGNGARDTRPAISQRDSSSRSSPSSLFRGPSVCRNKASPLDKWSPTRSWTQTPSWTSLPGPASLQICDRQRSSAVVHQNRSPNKRPRGIPRAPTGYDINKAGQLHLALSTPHRASAAKGPCIDSVAGMKPRSIAHLRRRAE